MPLDSSAARLLLDGVLAALTGGVFALTVNRLVQRKLRLTLWLVAAAALTTVVVWVTPLSEAAVQQGRSLATLLRALGAVNLIVVVALNPLRADRIPERFPNIVQDAIIVGLFAVVAVLVLREQAFATSAVGAVVVGFALQDTLGNAFAGLAIQVEKPFRVGQWIRVGEHEGRVMEITWRATKLRTKADSFVIVPNNVVSKEAIVNYSEPVVPVRVSVDVGATYARTPNEVKSAIFEATRNAPLVLSSPAPDVLLMDFGSSSIVYRVRFWVEDYARDDRARDQVRSAIYYSFARHGIEIPFPIQVEYQREEAKGRGTEVTARFEDVLHRVAVFASLEGAARRELAEAGAERIYAAGETVVRQGEPGTSMFVVCEGDLSVRLDPPGAEVARLGPETIFGEMSLLLGSPRSASVTALTDCRLMEITGEAFRRFVLEQPSVLEDITAAVLSRQEELARTRASAETATAPESPRSFLARVRQFLGIR